jgi:hypothetical protein
MLIYRFIHDMEPREAQGLYLADSWLWTRDAESCRWAERFHARQHRMPSSLRAADYSAATQYLKSVATVGSTDPEGGVRHLRNSKLKDVYVSDGRIRGDGRHWPSATKTPRTRNVLSWHSGRLQIAFAPIDVQLFSDCSSWPCIFSIAVDISLLPVSMS